ncbi:unnamed protein product [Kuraishia capsulata CBS 1993]|uniref:RRM domain-containing protein n=1 Tax=Kuraishia capsulata CBS 1993 TaxID=1382522 RepID=W6MTL0_9ASCO|nr:uncharacterized protein KUCA_T00001077001 [Kuraishia capsulata CBS 1993]CDK25110.1 unnamed protein product [Kuraishia capsulata CBS 1993]
MDIRQLSQTPLMEPNSVQRRPSISSLSSASGYASSTYGNSNSYSTAAIPPNTTGNSFLSSRVTQSRHFGPTSTQNLQQSPRASQNAQVSINQMGQQQGFNPNWLPQTTPMMNVGPWIEQQAQVAPDLNPLAPINSISMGALSQSMQPHLSDLDQLSMQVPSTAPSRNNSIGTKPQLDDKSGSVSDDEAKDDDLIPTAIVIKNIPFAIKKEQLLDVMTKLSLPLPYAFNYHFDNGVFRGLAFANFTSTDEASLVVNQLNGREIGGRKLRVEYKKMLPLVERERIEREKREKRGQLEEQHRSSSATSLASMYSTASAPAGAPANKFAQPTDTPQKGQQGISPSSVSSAVPDRLYAAMPQQPPIPPAGLDFNDPEVLELYSQFLVFRDDKERAHSELAYAAASSASQRRAIPQLCAFMGLSDSYENGLVIVKRLAPVNPGLIRSHSFTLQSQTGAIAGQGGRYRQQSPRNVGSSVPQSQSQSQQFSGFPPQQPQQQSQQQPPPPGLQSNSSTSNLALNAAMLRGPRPNSQLNLLAQPQGAKPGDFRIQQQQQSQFVGMMNSPNPQQQQQQTPFMAFNNGSSSSVQKTDDLPIRLDYLSFN